MAEVKMQIAVDDVHLDRVDEVAARLREAGMEVGEELTTLGVITGSVEADRLEDLKSVEGVADVELSRDSFALLQD